MDLKWGRAIKEIKISQAKSSQVKPSEPRRKRQKEN